MRFAKWDLIPIAAVTVLALVVFLLFVPAKTPGNYAQIYKNGELLRTLSLTENTTIAVGGNYTNVITVRDGKIAITQTDCPGGDCKACGWFSTAGSIVCLPNGVEIRVVSQTADVDIVVG